MNMTLNKDMDSPCLCIAGTHSGCGKTTVSLGIMSALVNRGLSVQAFKVGPDFIDPGHHRRITGRDSHSLDGWMMSREMNHDIFGRYSRNADVVVVEGVMGLFDGFSGRDESGSTAQMAKWLGLPTIIVVDAQAMARSAAAVTLGFSSFDQDLPLRGVIFNNVGSKAHRDIIDDAMQDFPHVPVIGYLPREAGIEIPSRHLGLVTDEDFRADFQPIEGLGRWIEDNLDIASLLESLDGKTKPDNVSSAFPEPDVRIGIAKDEAFCFYYPENLRLIRMAGSELIPFSPLRSERLPEDLGGLIIGGGYPELHCGALSKNNALLAEIKDFGLAGKPVYAECGGFMYLMNEIRDFEGTAYPMVGIFSMTAQMEEGLRALGYREIITESESMLGPAGTTVKGHEFHYSRLIKEDELSDRIYSMKDRMGVEKNMEGYRSKRVVGSYVHLHWGSNPKVAESFVDYCLKYG